MAGVPGLVDLETVIEILIGFEEEKNAWIAAT